MNGEAWKFPLAGGGIQGGIADAAQELFAGNHEKFLARETIQNSLDAKAEGADGPVKVTFRHMQLRISDIPDITELNKIMRMCRSYEINNSEPARLFFNRARVLLGDNTISVLSIEDYNTTGVTGSDTDVNDKWMGLIKFEGRSTTNSEARGGTFGIGKAAPFVASSIRTVLYSTKTKKGVAFQGVSRLTSFKDNKGEVRQRVGFYGVEQGQDIFAIRDVSKIPPKFIREDIGTSIFVLGYKPSIGSDWREMLLEDILQNCWAAIYDNRLEVELIDDSGDIIKVCNENLRAYVDKLNARLENNKLNPKFYLDAMVNGKYAEEEIPTLGKVQLYLDINENGTKHIELMRTPRLVVEARSFAAFPYKFNGVFICDDSKGNKLLSDTEPVDHRRWMRNKNVLAVDAVRDWVVSKLKELAPESSSVLLQVPDLSDYLPLEEEETNGSSGGDAKDGVENKATKPEIGKAKLHKRVRVVVEGVPGESGTRLHHGKRKHPRPKPDKDGGEKEPGGPEKLIDTSQITFRSFMVGPGTYEVVISSDMEQLGAIELHAVGEDDDYGLPISEAIDATKDITLPTNGSLVDGVNIMPGITSRIILKLGTTRRYKVGIR